MRSSKYRPRLVITAAVAAALLVTGAGCSSSPSSGGGGGAVDLSLMIWDPAQKAGVQKAVDGFEAENPDVNVSLEQVPEDQYYTKLDASLGAGEGPDVMWQSSKAPDYVNGGALEPLSEYIKKDKVSLDAYPKQLTKLYEFDGKQYGMPKDQDAWTFIYNTAVFNELGVDDVPTAEWTWEDMTRIAGEIKAKQTSSVDVPMSYDYQFNIGAASLIHAMGGKVVKDGKASVASPEGEKAFEMIKSLQDQGLIPKIADSADFDPVSSLISGSLAMAEIPSWKLSLLSQADVPAGTFQVVRLPSVDGSWASDTNGLSYVMNANSSHKDAAWDLIKFLTSDQGAILHAQGGASPPANISADAQEAFVTANDELTGLGDALEATHEENYLRTSTEFPKTRPSLPEIDSTVMGPFYAGSVPASEATKKVGELLDKALG